MEEEKKEEAKWEPKEDGCCLSADRLQLRIELYQDSPSPRQHNGYTGDPKGKSVDTADLFRTRLYTCPLDLGSPGNLIIKSCTKRVFQCLETLHLNNSTLAEAFCTVILLTWTTNAGGTWAVVHTKIKWQHDEQFLVISGYSLLTTDKLYERHLSVCFH